MEFEWKIFPGITTLGILEEIEQFMTEPQCEPEQFKDRIIFMSMYNDFVWESEETQKSVSKISYSCELCSQILARTLVIFGTWIREEMVWNSCQQAKW